MGGGIFLSLKLLFLLLFLSQGHDLSKTGMLLMLLIFPLLSNMSLFEAAKLCIYKDCFFKASLLGEDSREGKAGWEGSWQVVRKEETHRVRQRSYLLIFRKPYNKETPNHS